MGSPSGGNSVTTASPYAPWLQGHLVELADTAADYAYGGRQGEPFGFDQVSDDYLARTAPRFAQFDPFQSRAQQAAADAFERGDMYGGRSSSAMDAAIGGLSSMQAIQPTYQERGFDFGTFDRGTADRYMNPYMQSVVDQQMLAAGDEFKRQQSRSDAERVASGARGGYREAVDQAVARAQQGRVMADIQARGSESAFRDAQEQFERDRAASITAARMGDESAFRAAQERMNAARENEANRLRQAQAFADMGGRYSDLDTQAQARDIQRRDAMSAAGRERQTLEQAMRDQAFAEYMREFDYPMEQMRFLSGILAGVPTQANAYVRTPGPSIFQQGLGTAATLGGAYLAGRR
jgi:hypothetical protein